MQHETIQFLKCSAAGQNYCLNHTHVLALERAARLTPNPAGHGPSGWIARWGRKIPVYPLAERLGTGPRTSTVGAILLLDRNKPWGLSVERVSRYDLPAQPVPVPATIDDRAAAWFRAVVVDDGKPVFELAPERLRPDAPPLSVAPLEPANLLRRADKSPGRLLVFTPPNPAASETRLLFGLSYTQVIEIVSSLEPVPVPASPAHVLGLIAWRGQPVPVIDVGLLLGLEPIATHKGRLLIARSALWRTVAAIPIGAEMQTRGLPLPHRPCPQERNYARGCFELSRSELLVIPDLDAIARPRSAA